MAATKIVSGVIREVWRETANQANVSVPIPTGLRVSTRQLPRVRAQLIIDSVVGAPVITAVASIVNKRLVVTVANSAGGTTFNWTLDVELTQASQQGSSAQAAVIEIIGGGALPGVPSQQNLSQTYNFGTLTAHQTMTLTDDKGGGVVLDGTDGGFTGAVHSLEIKGPNLSVVQFPRSGGSTQTIIQSQAVAGFASPWKPFEITACILTLTGAPGAITAVGLMHIDTLTINGAGTTIGDAYNLFIDDGPSGSATITRSWSLCTIGNIQCRKNLYLTDSPDGIAAGASGTLAFSNINTMPVGPQLDRVYAGAENFVTGTNLAALSLVGEEPAVAVGALVVDTVIPIRYNGISYYLTAINMET